jgi:hypothetical protein
LIREKLSSSFHSRMGVRWSYLFVWIFAGR